MASLSKALQVYHEALDKGDIQRAYRFIIKFMSELRTELAQKYPEYKVTQVYQGYMDMSYFAISAPELRAKKLKIALVYLHQANRFELWLSASNRKVQKEWIDVFNQKENFEYRISELGVGIDSIVEYIVHVSPNFEAKAALKQSLAMNIVRFIKDMEGLINHEQGSEHA
ncbi:MAG TPA: hypothetical protein DIC19_05010 [Erysipelotrichaceae bacterium]|nr:hypothetical protein [Erysipelotrichaceae bacterium]